MFVRDAANKAWDKVPWDGPLCVNVTVHMPRPQAHFSKKTGLKPNAPKFHISKPDVDNLTKSILDALTNLGVWKDDSIVADHAIKKVYANGQTGAQIEIKECECEPQEKS